MSQTTCFKSLLNFVLMGVCLLSSFTALHAQNPAVLQTVSPYSRFGIGEFQMNGSMINAGMGGGGIGVRNDSLIPQYFNFANPASLTSNNFVSYEVSMLSNTVQLNTATEKGTFNRTTLGNFSLAFPVTKWWGAGMGLVPYSAVGYNVSNSDSLVGVGPVTYKYEGSGGVSQVFLSNGFRPFSNAKSNYLLSSKYEHLKLTGDTSAMKKQIRIRNGLSNISIGVQTSYLFGSLNNTRRDVFPDSMNTFNTKIQKRSLFHDVYFNYGVQYSFRLRKSLNPEYVGMNDSVVTGKRLFRNEFYYSKKGQTDTAALFVHAPGIRVSFGAIFSTQTSIGVTDDWLAQTYKQVGTIEQFRDTIYQSLDYKTQMVIPAMYGFGFSLKKDYKWMFQADYMTQMWSQASSNNINYGLKNAQRITAGFQFQPKAVGRGKYMSAVQYRLGVKYYQTAIEIRNTQLNETSANFGMSLPVPYRTKLGEPISRATVNLEFGMRGTTDQNLIRENFFRVTVGFTINDRWFAHFKYD